MTRQLLSVALSLAVVSQGMARADEAASAAITNASRDDELTRSGYDDIEIAPLVKGGNAITHEDAECLIFVSCDFGVPPRFFLLVVTSRT